MRSITSGFVIHATFPISIWKREKELHFANTLPASFEAFERGVQARFRSLAHVQCRVGRTRRGRTVVISKMIKDLLLAA